MKRKLILLALCLMLVVSVALAASAENTGIAQDLRKSTTISGSGYSSFKFLLDDDISTYKKSDGNATINLQNEAGIGSLYLMFNLEYGEYTITNNETGDIEGICDGADGQITLKTCNVHTIIHGNTLLFQKQSKIIILHLW